LKKGGLRQITHDELPRRLTSIGETGEHVAPPGWVGRAFPVGLAGHGHRGELDEEAVPGLPLVGLKRLEAQNVVLGELVENLRKCPRLYRLTRNPDAEEFIIKQRESHDAHVPCYSKSHWWR
jgi:hypothetical protein